MSRVWPARLSAQDRRPASVGGVGHGGVNLFARAGREAALDADLGCLVPCEEGRVDLHSTHSARRNAEPYHHPVRFCRVVSPCLPSVIPCARVYKDARLAHRCGRGSEILRGRKPFIRDGDDAGPEWFRDEICCAQVSRGETTKREPLCACNALWNSLEVTAVSLTNAF